MGIMKLCIVAACLASSSLGMLVPPNFLRPTNEQGGSNWAVLVAGSAGWFNYRHQADICHAYQILHRNGYPDERIIVMMVDDIAENTQNPNKGVLINHPNGKDVYHDVPHDYTGPDVTPENFVKVLTGDREGLNATAGSRKFLQSGPNDDVFVNFVDHGGPGIIGFPQGFMSSQDLIGALETMTNKKMFRRLVFYMEACESGSMFEGLLPNSTRIYTTTAANAQESSYATYFDPLLSTYLGDMYSCAWMEDTEHYFNDEDSSESLDEQYKNLRKFLQPYSHAQQYGDMSYAQVDLDHFLSFDPKSVRSKPHKRVEMDPSFFMDAIDSRDVPIALLEQRILEATTERAVMEAQEELQEELLRQADAHHRMQAVVRAARMDKTFELAMRAKLAPLTREHHSCMHAALHAFDLTCHRMDERHARYAFALAQLCQQGLPTSHILAAIAMAC